MKIIISIVSILIGFYSYGQSVQEIPLAKSIKGIPEIGQKMKVNHPVCRINTRWNKRENFTNIYAAPSGWQILEFKAIPISTRQSPSYRFDSTPSNFGLITSTVIETKLNDLMDYAVELGKEDKYKAKINEMKNDYEKYLKKIVSTHSQITTTGNVRGDNNTFARYPGRLYLDLEIILVYFPDSEEQFLRSIEVMMDIIKNDQ